MTSSISWIDRDGLAETLARFSAPGGTAPPVPRIPSSAFAPPPPPPTPPRRLSAFEPRRHSLSERLEEFIDWLGQVTGCGVAFVTDRDGLPLVDRGADADVMAIASSFVQLVERINRQMSSVVGQAMTLQLDKGQLILVTVETPIGLYTVGRVDRRGPDPGMHLSISAGLQAVFGGTQPAADA